MRTSRSLDSLKIHHSLVEILSRFSLFVFLSFNQTRSYRFDFSSTKLSIDSMGIPQDFCRFCLTSNEDGKFNVITQEDNVIIKSVWNTFRVKIQEFPIFSCASCERDIKKAAVTCDRIHDVTDFMCLDHGLNEKQSSEEPCDVAHNSTEVVLDAPSSLLSVPLVPAKRKPSVAARISKKTRKTHFECGVCMQTFDSMAKLNSHLTQSSSNQVDGYEGKISSNAQSSSK